MPDQDTPRGDGNASSGLASWVRWPGEFELAFSQSAKQYGFTEDDLVNWRDTLCDDIAQTPDAFRIGWLPGSSWRRAGGGMTPDGFERLAAHVSQDGVVDLTWCKAFYHAASDCDVRNLALDLGLRLRDEREFSDPPDEAWLEVYRPAISDAFALRAESRRQAAPPAPQQHEHIHYQQAKPSNEVHERANDQHRLVPVLEAAGRAWLKAHPDTPKPKLRPRLMQHLRGKGKIRTGDHSLRPSCVLSAYPRNEWPSEATVSRVVERILASPSG